MLDTRFDYLPAASFCVNMLWIPQPLSLQLYYLGQSEDLMIVKDCVAGIRSHDFNSVVFSSRDPTETGKWDWESEMQKMKIGTILPVKYRLRLKLLYFGAVIN